MVPGYSGSNTASPSTRTSPSRASEATASASRGCEPATTARRAAARRWRNEPSNGPWRRVGSKRRPRDGQAAGERADAAAGDPGEADRLAQIHQRLPGRRGEVVAGPLRHAPHVDVDGQNRVAEGERGDRVGGIAADAGQLGQVVGPAVSRNLLRGAVERERAPVVAEPLPLPDHVAGRGRGERLHGRPALEPAPPARHDALDLRLLRHDLADEDRVRIARLPPGQVAAVSAEPGQEKLVHQHEPRSACCRSKPGRAASRFAHRVRARSTGRAARDQACMPPLRFSTWWPLRRSARAAAALRWPLAQTVTIVLSWGSVASRLFTCMSGTFREPWMWPWRHSLGWRTSSTYTLPLASLSARSAGSVLGMRVKRPTVQVEATRSRTRASLSRTCVAIGASSSLPTIESMRSASIAEMCVSPSRS